MLENPAPRNAWRDGRSRYTIARVPWSVQVC